MYEAFRRGSCFDSCYGAREAACNPCSALVPTCLYIHVYVYKDVVLARLDIYMFLYIYIYVYVSYIVSVL